MFSKLFIVVTAISATALAQSPALSCYPAGGTSGINDCAQFIGTFCADVTQSSFGPGQNGGRCFGVNDKRCDFIVYRDPADPAAPPSSVSCNTVLNGVVNSCPYGGTGKMSNATHGYYIFTLDPNAGACSANVQRGS